ncbi:hypothetical protein JCM11641_002767 [Rhodosporidiobolus odoratus]
MLEGDLYDPPMTRRSSSRARGRSASMSGSGITSGSPQVFGSARRMSMSSMPTTASSGGAGTGNLSDDEAAPLVDLVKPVDTAIGGPSAQDPADAAADRKLWREGRQSKAQLLADDPTKPKMTGDMEQFMAQLFDLTHSIDALENDIDEILRLRNMIATLNPRVDVGQTSLRADLDSLSALTTQTGKTIVSLETWLLQLHKWSKDVKKLVKAGKAGETMQEVGEIKAQLASAKLDFADAMERVREGAWKEQERRERTRIWMARHIRAREPEIEDKDVKGLLKASELGAADGVAQSDVTSYAGLFALQNPFTELAELTNGMRFLHDDLDREIVDTVTGKKAKKRTIYVNLDGTTPKKSKKSSSKKSSSSSKKSAKRSSAASQVVPEAPAQWFGSRYGFISTMRPHRTGPNAEDDEFERKYRYIQAEQFAAEKDLEYGFARQEQMDRINRRKKLVIALLLVLIAALILFVVLATMQVPDQTVSWRQGAGPPVPSIGTEPVPAVTPGPDAETKPSEPSSEENDHESSSDSSESSSETDSTSTSSSETDASSVISSAIASAGTSSSASSPAFNNGLYNPTTTAAAVAQTVQTSAAGQQQTVWWTAPSA